MVLGTGDSTLIASLFQKGVITSEANPRLISEPVYPEEETLVRNAVPARKQQFSAGRLCVRTALAKIGIRDFPLLMGKDGAPMWPPEIVGSISHTEGYCGVALARKREIESVGLDVECVGRLNRDSWKHICTRQELSWISLLFQEHQEKNLALIFSAKECLYKCQYAISKQWLDFDDVCITVAPDTGEFEARFMTNVGGSFAKGTSLKGKYLFHHNYVFTGITLAVGSGQRLI